MLIDESVRKKYELKYRIVEQKMDRTTINMIFLFVYILLFNGVLIYVLFSLKELFNSAFVFILFLLAYIFVFSFIFRKLSKKIRDREEKGFVQFFSHHMLIFQNGENVELQYNHIHRVAYSKGIVDDYFSKSPVAITRYYKFILTNETIVFFECECFIQANKLERKNKTLPDVGRVIKRIMPPGGIAENKREIKNYLKAKKSS